MENIDINFYGISGTKLIHTNSTQTRLNAVRGAQSQFANIEKFSLNFANSSFVIDVNLLHPQPSLFLYGLSLSLWCFSFLLYCYFLVSFKLKVILYVAKITQNIVTKLLTTTKTSWYFWSAAFIWYYRLSALSLYWNVLVVGLSGFLPFFRLLIHVFLPSPPSPPSPLPLLSTQCDGCLGDCVGAHAAGLQGLSAMAALYCSEVSQSQWRPLDILGTHLPYNMMQLSSLFKMFRKILLLFVVVGKKHLVIMAGYVTRKYIDSH